MDIWKHFQWYLLIGSKGGTKENSINTLNVFQDSKRFEGIDSDFNELANDANKTPNVVEATNKPGLYEKLEDIQAR